MSAWKEKMLVDECNRLGDSIQNDLIRFQDQAYDLGFKRGQVSAFESIQWTSANGFTFCPSCNHTEQAGHSPHCLIGNALKKAQGGGE